MSVRTRYTFGPEYASLWDEFWLKPGAPQEVIDAVYRALSKKYHPDTGVENPEAQARLNHVYRKLSEMTRRGAKV